MLHVWLIPLLVILLVVLIGFYLGLRHRGGSGVRTDGRCLVDDMEKDEDPPPPG